MDGVELHSVVVPMHNEAAVVDEFFRRTLATLSTLPNFEIVVVDDGSTDGTWAALCRYATSDPRIRAIRLSRNFGQQAASTAGIDIARGDTLTVIDADLQDPPEVIHDMIARWRDGADIVFGVRRARAGETLFKRWTASMYHRLLNSLSDSDIPVGAGDFRLLSRRAADVLRAMPEHNRYMRGLVAWIGLERAFVEFDREARKGGETNYSTRSLVSLAIQGLISFSTVPLRVATWLGLSAAGIGLLVIIYALYQRLAGHQLESGWASIIISVLFLGGTQLLVLGIFGEYLARVYDEVRHRPLYLLRDLRNVEPPSSGAGVGDAGTVAATVASDVPRTRPSALPPSR